MALGIKTFRGASLRGRPWASARALDQWASAFRPEMVHSHGYEANYILALARFIPGSELRRIPIVMTCHGWIEITFNQRVKTSLDFATYRIADVFIICSPHQRPRLTKSEPQKPIFYVPNGVFIDNCRTQPCRQLSDLMSKRAEGRRVVGYVGRLCREKEVGHVIETFSRLIVGRSDLILAIVGAGPEEPALRAMTHRLGISESVLFIGHVVHTATVYRNFDLLMLTSSTEGTSRAILEAMAEDPDSGERRRWDNRIGGTVLYWVVMQPQRH